MKKILLLLVLTLAVSFYGCSERTPISVDTFKQTMTEAGFIIHDVSDQFDPGIARSVTVALKSNDYRVEFFVLTSEANAAASFANNKSNLEPLAGGNVTTSKTMSNYSSYTLTTKEQFYGVYRVGDTMIYLRAPRDQKDAVAKLVKDLGY